MSSGRKRKRTYSPEPIIARKYKHHHHEESAASSRHRPSKYQSTTHQSEKPSLSEKVLSFDWGHYKWELNKLFFSEKDYIQYGSDEYNDFWKFLKKYQGMKKDKFVKEMCKNPKEIPKNDKASRSRLSFSLKMESYDKLQSRLPPIDLEDNYKRLSPEKIEEFHSIIEIYINFLQKQNFDKIRKLRKAQKSLPIREHKEELLKTLEDNNVVILAGDTGCGKSTQVPQYLMEAGYCSVACTQPRRIACISLAKRVAYETLNEYGSKVGYQIRFEKHRTQHTNIVFLTEGLLLRQVVSDPTLSSYSVIILDEIHERHLHTDFLLGVVKCLLVQRKDIKIVLMSATININLFYNYFQGEAPVIQVPGRLFPIDLKYCPIPLVEKAEKNGKLDPAPYIRVLQLIDHKYPTTERGDVLVFLSGMKEITTVEEAAQTYAQQSRKWIILSLHSTLSITDQEKVFDIAPQGIRKCILSTNIAETSVTIDGIRFVIDSGKVKEMTHDPTCKIQRLKETWISQASAEQRKGRAGRTGPGTCFRLYDEEEYSAFAPYTKPEIQRVPLDSLVLQMISMGLPNMKLFPFVEPPSSESLQASVKSLQFHAALTNDEALTDVGQLLSVLPLDISLGKMLIMGSLFHQTEPVLSLAALLSVQTPYTNRALRDPDCVALNKEFECDHGDPFTLLRVYREWLYIKIRRREDSRKWCRKRGLEEQRFYEMTKLRQQFNQMLNDGGLKCLSVKLAPTSGAERARKYGTLQQLRDLKRELNQQGPRKAKLLKLNDGISNSNADEDADVSTKIKDLDFRISYDTKKLQEIYDGLNIESFKDTLLLKIIITSGLYPNIAIPDEFNNYKPGSEQVFHTLLKPGVTPHPNGIYANHSEVLQLTEPDICALPGFSLRNPCSSRHQLLVFVSLLETNKAYVVNSLRIPTAQTCLLFANNIDTNVDFSLVVCDQFIELKFAEALSAQTLIFRAVQLRLKWQELLQLKMKAAKLDPEDQVEILLRASIVEKDLCVGLLELFTEEPLYSAKRLLSADVKLLYQGPGFSGDVSTNPFVDSPPSEHETKGGLILTDFLTYNCLVDLNSSGTILSSFDWICPYCDGEMHTSVIERLCHFSHCLTGKEQERAEEETVTLEDKSKKEFFCDVCKTNIRGSLKDIFDHKKTHIQ